MPRATARSFNRENTLSQRLTLIGPPLLLVVLLLVPPPEGSGASLAGLPSLCLFHNATGLPCPGCGITRSLVCCAHGLFAQGFGFHPLGPVVFAGLAGMTLTSLISIARPGYRLPLPPRWVTGAAWVSLVLLGIIWVGRLSGVFPSPP